MKLEIFDVEHGQCSLLTGDAGTHALIDAGHNGGTGWRPSTMLNARGIRRIDRFFITNYDEDHASDLHNVLSVATIGILHRNKSVGTNDLYKLKNIGGVGQGIKALCGLFDTHVHPVTHEPDFGGVSIQTFCNKYPADFEDENNLSLLVILSWGNLSIAYTGDLETAGWKKLLAHQGVREALRGVNVFMASHHGRLNGYCEEIFTATGMQPAIIVVSDSGIDYETQKTGPLYRKHATGIDYNGQMRRVFTTRRDGTITLSINTAAGTGTLSTSRDGPALF